MIKVLYISYDGMTDPLGQSQVIPYLKGLSKEGYHFSLLSCEKKERFEKSKNLVKEILQGYNIEWHPLIYHKHPPVLSTLYDYFVLKTEAVRLHKKEKFEIVHSRSYIASLVGFYLKRKYEVPFVFDMRGFWADERVDGGLWNLKNPLHKLIYNYFKKQESLFLKYSDATISLTEAGKNEMMTWEVCKSNKIDISVIPCSADFDFFIKPDEEKINLFKSTLGIPRDSFVLSYVGSIGTWYMLDEMLDLFKALLLKNSNSVFLILTADDPQFVYSKLKGIDRNKVVVQFASREELVNKISISDVSVFFIKPCYSKISSSPTKLGELLAMGIPVISNSGVGDVNEILSETGGGIIIDEFEQRNYANAIKEIPSLIALDKNLIREKAKNYFDLRKSVNKYAEIYRKLLD